MDRKFMERLEAVQRRHARRHGVAVGEGGQYTTQSPPKAAEQPPGNRALCRCCRKIGQIANSGGRCEGCWAYAAARWSWNGLTLNAFKHRRRG